MEISYAMFQNARNSIKVNAKEWYDKCEKEGSFKPFINFTSVPQEQCHFYLDKELKSKIGIARDYLKDMFQKYNKQYLEENNYKFRVDAYIQDEPFGDYITLFVKLFDSKGEEIKIDYHKIAVMLD